MLTDKAKKLCADILVEKEYGLPPDMTTFPNCKDLDLHCIRIKDDNWPSEDNYRLETIGILADTLEGRRQADVIGDWLVANRKDMWLLSMSQFGFDDRPKHQWRLDRICWCLNKLTEGE